MRWLTDRAWASAQGTGTVRWPRGGGGGRPDEAGTAPVGGDEGAEARPLSIPLALGGRMAGTSRADCGPCCRWPALRGGPCLADTLLCQPHRQGQMRFPS